MTAFLTSLSRLLLWYAPALALIIASRLALMYFQLSSYQFMGFLAALKRQSRRVWLPGALPGVACLVITYLAGALAQVNTAWAIISPLLGAGLMLACAYWADLLSYRRREGKSSLKMTARVKRLYAVYAALMFVAFSLLRRAAPIMGLNAMVILPLPLWVLLAGLMAWPIERVIYELYFRDAQKALRERPDLTLIGITGSYGKTSVKFFLQTILSQKYNALCTPTSVNTPMGISACLRRDLTPAHNVFIAEMGARHRGDIKELCRLLRPSIGILTSVGPQHLETLGDIETVKQTKYDLIRALPSDGFAVFGDNSGIVRDLYENTRIPKAITDAPDTDIWAEDVLADEDSTRFTLCFKDGRRLCCQTYVQGAHALRNILTASAVAAHLGLSDRQLIHGIALIHPVKNRFRIDTGADGVHRINNGFNSNPVSSAETLEELSRDKYEGRRIIITPGFVELGREEEKYNRELGVNIAKVADIVLLVGPRHTAPIRQGLLESGFHAGDIHTFDTLMDANAYLDTVKQQGDYVLYENDLPDHYSEKKEGKGMKKLQLGLIFGGRSCEHEVSVISALQLSRSVDRAKYDLYPIYISKSGEWFSGAALLDLGTYREPILYAKPGEFERVTLDITAHSGALTAVRPGKWLYSRPKTVILTHLDCIIPVMHGLHGEDGSLQGLLEMADIPYTSSGVVGSAAGMDKIIMKQVFRGAGIPVLEDQAVLRSKWLSSPEKVCDRVESTLAYPVFVKPANLGSSIGVSRANNRGELKAALHLACEYDRRILVEQGLDHPIEVNCSVLGFDDDAVASVLEMPSTGGDVLGFFEKYLKGSGAKGMASLARTIPAPVGDALTRKVKALSLKVFSLLDCKGVVRIDWMIDPATDELYITEINTIPGSMAFYLWKESEPRLRYHKLIDKLVEMALKAHQEKTDNNYAYRSDLFDKMSLTGSKGSKGTKA